MSSKRSLKEILASEYVEDSDDENSKLGLNEDELDEPVQEQFNPNYCGECQDMELEIKCNDCEEQFCVTCFDMLHRGGKRKNHGFVKLNVGRSLGNENTPTEEADQKKLQDINNDANENQSVDEPANISVPTTNIDDSLLAQLYKHSQYIPMRLTHEERHLLRLLEAALEVSEYTDRVDILSYKSKSKRILEQLREMCSVLCGLVIASNLKIGKKLLELKNFSDNADWFKDIFEIGRRYKIMNPDRMRATYGKLCYMVMDSRLPEIEDHMEFHLYKPVKTVHTFLGKSEDNGKALAIFQDKLILYATADINPTGKARAEIQRMIKQKEAATEKLASKYSTSVYSKEDIRQVLYSIGDYNAYVNSNRRPIMRLLERLLVFRDPIIEEQYSLGIQYGRDGARLTHDHKRQWQYAQQSLLLWSTIQREMVHLWYISDIDLFNGTPYRLSSTGQGLNRVKSCPALYKQMHNILNECRSKCDSWVGSSVVHLGDDAVPNALFFLDKYTQIPNILIPFDQTLLQINDLVKHDSNLEDYIIKEYGSVDDLKLTILQDAFSHMFDGSGADNFYMSGSCIDGRLTSAWNFTNQISKKKYYKIFLMTRFIGFNGSQGF
ncbi:unnamed protein product [Kluyveromyces dobzhanskii CBS 2104]|uniref:WGS project CCBQ000000000 data, contig 00006 n=1 Tax=Kluyveromyces dobzhanskii CBS 2104 TaxID=1427455 RepID=A0A0A8L7T6_9SACH|nr:unnamed protein product [Kluyveromyces dobzhanskii CBS 2104]